MNRWFYPRGFRGFGQVTPGSCPSLQQLQGIADPTDPCQAANAPVTADMLANIKDFFYQQGQLNASSSQLAPWVLPAAIVLGVFLVVKAVQR